MHSRLDSTPASGHGAGAPRAANHSPARELTLDPELAAQLEAMRARSISPEHDPWDPWLTYGLSPEPLLTSIEVTVTNQCNLRCEHCAVGELLTYREERRLPLETIIEALDAVPTLLTFSLTGGELSVSQSLVDEVVIPLLRYAKGRGLKTQVNTNLTLPLERYQAFVEWVDVLHISYNYPHPDEFARIAYAHAGYRPLRPHALLERMERNTIALAEQGVFVSAETILTNATIPHIDVIHRRIRDLGCQRHEIHPLYPSDFAATMTLPPLADVEAAIERLLAGRDPGVWLLFGTLPIFACSPDPRHHELLQRIHSAPRTTVRNDPDGRNRLNISSLDGSVRLQDFADVAELGDITQVPLLEIWRRWLASPTAKRLHCCCPEARCLGPNLLVAQSYYPHVAWEERSALIAL